MARGPGPVARRGRGRSRGGRRRIDAIAYDPRRDLPFEVLTLQSLHARAPRDLTAPERPGFHLVLLATRGRGRHVVDFVEHRLRVGDVLAVAAGQVQQYAPRAAFDALLLVLRPDAVRWAPAPGGGVLSLSRQRRALVRGLFAALARELGPDGGRSSALAAHLVEAVGVALSAPSPVSNDGQRLVQRFTGELERHFRRAHEVAAYAALLRCSTKTLARHCLRWLGQAPKRVIDERLLLEARRVLAHEDVTVAELAEQLGFGSATQLTKFFRRLARETPARFRARVRGKGWAGASVVGAVAASATAAAHRARRASAK